MDVLIVFPLIIVKLILNREKSKLIGIKLPEKRKQREMAKRLLLKGMDIPFIEDTAGLSAKEVMQISEKLGLSN